VMIEAKFWMAYHNTLISVFRICIYTFCVLYY